MPRIRRPEQAYVIVGANTLTHLAERVNRKIEQGYEPVGSPFAHKGENLEGKIHQALFKPNAESNDHG